MQKDDILKFPEGFFWGSATASYQVEGGIENNDWAEAAREGKVPVCGRATDHYNLYEKDFDIIKSLGQNAHRFSIEWARIEPEEGVFDEKEVEHYRAVIRALKARGLEPFATLWHFTLPAWFTEKGGFENKNAPEIFAKYCSFVIEKFGNEVKYWTTINEPLIWASGGYLKGVWPPFKKNIFLFLRVFKSLVKSHIAAYDAMKKVNKDIQIGISKHNIFFESDSLLWNKLLASTTQWFWNHRFLNRISNKQDFIGLNFYIHKRFGSGPTYPQTEMGWDIFPQGIYMVLVDLKRYNKPIYITENGIADSNDSKREDYIRSYLKSIRKALEEKVDIQGYFYWSLLDNYEWSFGFEKRFGLVEIDYETLERKIRPSAFAYKQIIENSGL